MSAAIAQLTAHHVAVDASWTYALAASLKRVRTEHGDVAFVVAQVIESNHRQPYSIHCYYCTRSLQRCLEFYNKYAMLTIESFVYSHFVALLHDILNDRPEILLYLFAGSIWYGGANASYDTVSNARLLFLVFAASERVSRAYCNARE